MDFLSKLAALVPRPRHNLVRYHGVLARGCHQPNAKMRKLIIPKSRNAVKAKEKSKANDTAEDTRHVDELVAPLSWAQRLKRVFNIDIALCPICGGTMRVIGRGRLRITDPDVIQQILDHIETRPPPLFHQGLFDRYLDRLLCNSQTPL